MQLVPNTWYRFADLFGSSAQILGDDTRRWQGDCRLFDSELSALSLAVAEHNRLEDEPRVTREHLQLTLYAVDRKQIDGLQDSVSPALLLRDAMFFVVGAGYAYDLIARYESLTYRSRGVVCASLNLEMDRQYSRRTLESRDEVRTAHQRGLLDDATRTRADFKLDIRPMQRKVQALQDSGHVPDSEWKVDVLFGYWRNQTSGEYVPSPLPPGELLPSALELEFVESARSRGFRITDLFSR